MLFGFAPAVHAWSISPISSLRDGGKASGTKVRSLFGKMLVTVQVAVSMLLLCAAGLFVQHLVNLEHVNLGFRRDHLLLVGLNPSHSGYKLEQLQILYQQLLSRLQSIPGVASASLSGSTPLSGSGESHFARVEGHPERPEDRRYFSVNRVAPKYFETFGTPLLAGRDFSFSDQHGGLVAIINQTVARSYFGDSSPLGRHIVFDGESKPYEIIGVVGDAKYYEILEPTKKTIYLNAFQEWFGPSQFTIRTAASPSTIAPAVRRVVSDSLKTVPVSRIRTMEEQVDASIVRERLIATLSGWFGALGSILVAVGLYGLLAYTVTRRINEIGIRMALGATRTKVTQMVLRDALATISVGTLIGLLLAFLGKRLAASLFAELPVANAMPVVIGIAAMFCTGLVSAYFPARRAAHIDPMNALRHE
jgi:predicted permease